MNHFKLLKQLCEMPGLSGFEDEVRALAARELKPFVHDLRVDAMGNLMARKRGRTSAARKVMISAHMDELGFLVTHIDDHGFLRLDRSGGVDIASMPGRSADRELAAEEMKQITGGLPLPFTFT